MKPEEVYNKGLHRGTESATIVAESDRYESPDELIQKALTSEQHSRQYSPFELLANEINEHDKFGFMWDEFERGVHDGILKVCDDLFIPDNQ